MAGMVKHVLVPLDLSTKNTRALTMARALAEPAGARVTLLHVIERVEGIPLGEMRDFYDRLKKRARERLAAAARAFTAAGIKVAQTIFVGVPARDIVKLAEATKADLIVISSHRVESPARPGQGLGTTSYKVAILCSCPVLLVK